MIRYIVLILLILFSILFLINIILNKLLKLLFGKELKKESANNKHNDVIYDKEGIVVLKGEAKNKKNNKGEKNEPR